MEKFKLNKTAAAVFLIVFIFMQGCHENAIDTKKNAKDTDKTDETEKPIKINEKLLILQAGASTDGAITRSFVELYNTGDKSVELSAFSLHYGATGANWTIIELTGSIPAKCSYLIRGPLGTETGESRLYIENADLTVDTFKLSNQGYKIALMENQNKLTVENPFSVTEGTVTGYVDMLGAYNSNAASVDAFETMVFSPISKQAAARRKSLVDTDNNFNDFERIDYRRVSGNNGINNDDLERFRPRYSEDGEWDPFSEPDGIVEPPVFSHISGLYAQSFPLTLTAAAGRKIYYSIDGSIPVPSKASSTGVIREYTAPIQVVDRNNPVQQNRLASYSEQFYMLISDPRGHPNTYYTPDNNQVPKATVIRAVAADEKGNTSDAITRTFFIGNNLSKYANHPVMSFVTDPYNLVDVDYGIFVRGRSYNRWDGTAAYNYSNIYNFCQRGAQWERPSVLELFKGNATGRTLDLSTTVGIRVRGGWSRDRAQKSLNVYFKSEHGGINNLRDYDLIPGAVQSDGQPITTYKSFMLRNGGNDTEQTKLLDVFVQNLLIDRNFATQAAVPCIVYINGEYWGFYNLQERYSDNHTEYKYGVDRNNVISYDNGGLDDGLPGEESLYFNMVSYKDKEMNAANYAEFCKIFDIHSFIDYWAAQIYINNQDWPQNNYRLWRTRVAEPGNPYGDTKWRYQMFDTEYALNIYNDASNRDPINEIVNGSHNSNPNNQLFKKLMTNSDFCRQFINTMLDLYNINFLTANFTAELNRLAAIHKPLMSDYWQRFNTSWNDFDGTINNTRNYLTNIRARMVNTILPAHFNAANLGVTLGGTSGLSTVTLNVSDGSAAIPNAAIKLNNATNLTIPASGSWSGSYYRSVPITVTAINIGGYTFSGWQVTGGTAATPSAETTTVTITGNAVITARYTRN